MNVTALRWNFLPHYVTVNLSFDLFHVSLLLKPWRKRSQSWIIVHIAFFLIHNTPCRCSSFLLLQLSAQRFLSHFPAHAHASQRPLLSFQCLYCSFTAMSGTSDAGDGPSDALRWARQRRQRARREEQEQSHRQRPPGQLPQLPDKNKADKVPSRPAQPPHDLPKTNPPNLPPFSNDTPPPKGQNTNPPSQHIPDETKSINPPSQATQDSVPAPPPRPASDRHSFSSILCKGLQVSWEAACSACAFLF